MPGVEAETVVNAHPDYFESQWSEEMRQKLGKRVRVTLQREPKEVHITGDLLMFSDDGEVAVRDEAFTTHWCWPNLETILL